MSRLAPGMQRSPESYDLPSRLNRIDCGNFLLLWSNLPRGPSKAAARRVARTSHPPTNQAPQRPRHGKQPRSLRMMRFLSACRKHRQIRGGHMKSIKGLMIGSATSLVVVAAAQAADLPVKAKAVEYVRICSAYGAGFWYIPGTDTCMKIGGYF